MEVKLTDVDGSEIGLVKRQNVYETIIVSDFMILYNNFLSVLWSF